MIFHKETGPKDKNFVGRVAPVVKYIVGAAIMFQLISAATEAFGVYQFGKALDSYLVVNIVFTAAIVAAWELSIRAGVMYISKTITQASTKKIKMDRLEIFLLVIAFIITGPIVYYSYFVSKENAHMTFQMMMPEADTTNVYNIDQSKTAELATIGGRYEREQEDIDKRYAEREKAAQGVYLAAKAKHNTNINQWRQREKSRGKKYTTYINREQDAINAAYEKYQSEKKEIADQKAAALSKLKEWRMEQEAGAITLAGEGFKEESNKREIFKNWFLTYSNIWAHFAGLSVILAILCYSFVQVYKVRAGIEDDVDITDEQADPSLFSELLYLLQLRFTAPVRYRVRKAINATRAKRVELEISAPVTQSVTHSQGVTGQGVTPANAYAKSVTPPNRSVIKPFQNRDESVTENRYGSGQPARNSALPTHITPVTPVTQKSVTHQPKRAVTPTVVEWDSPVTKKPEKKEQPVTDQEYKVVFIDNMKAKIQDRNGKIETVTLDQVKSRKRSNYGNVKNRKTKAAKERCKQLGDFYADLEKQIKRHLQ